MTDPHLADLLGLDLTDPEVIATLAEQREITAIRARVHEVLTRTGTTEGKLVALLGITADKTRAALAGERRFSTYELAVIATHGRTTVEWLCGDDDPTPPETAAGLARLRDAPDVFAMDPDDDRIAAKELARGEGRRFTSAEAAVAWLQSDDEPAEPNPRIQAAVAKLRAERTPTPERDGYTIAVYLPPGVSASVRAYLSQAIADVAHTADWHQDWDAHVVGQAGDPLGAVDETVRP